MCVRPTHINIYVRPTWKLTNSCSGQRTEINFINQSINAKTSAVDYYKTEFISFDS